MRSHAMGVWAALGRLVGGVSSKASVGLINLQDIKFQDKIKMLPNSTSCAAWKADDIMYKYKIVLARHGESEWNQKNIFCGWYDAELSDEGKKQAVQIANKLKNYNFDVVFTSLLKRAYGSVDIILKTLGRPDVPVKKAWKLNERHYGALTGFNKVEMAEKYGLEQVQIWRRSYGILPPPMDKNHHLYESIVNNPVFIENGIAENDVPATESLESLICRVVPYWNKVIIPTVMDGKKVLVVAHGTSLRGLIKHIESISEEEITKLNIPTGIPVMYHFNEDMKPVAPRKFFCDDETLRKEMAKVASIGTKEKKNL